MSLSIHKSTRAQGDPDDIVYYLEDVAGLNTAERFVDAFEKSAASIVNNPLIGSLCELSHPRLHDIPGQYVDSANT